MASGYSQAVSTGRDIEEEKQKGIAEAGKKQLDTEEFKLDKKVEYDKKAKKAADKFGKWQKGLGTIASLAAIATGVGAPLAAAMAGGGSMLGGVIGQKAAQKEMKGMNWLNKEQGDLFSGMRKSTGKKALTSAVMAGVTAHGAKAGEAGAMGVDESVQTVADASGRVGSTSQKIIEQQNALGGIKGAEVTGGYGWNRVKEQGWRGAYKNLQAGGKSLFSDDTAGKMGMGNTLLDYYNAQESERQGP